MGDEADSVRERTGIACRTAGSGNPGEPGAVRGLRCDKERRMGKRGNRQRYVSLRRSEHPPLVGVDGRERLSGSRPASDYGRFRRQQRSQSPALESGTTETGRRDRTGDLSLSPAARNQQAEQNRAPDVFVHPSELARQTAGKSPR